MNIHQDTPIFFMHMPIEDKLRSQFLNLYHFIAADSIVYILPASIEINIAKLALSVEGQNNIIIGNQNSSKTSEFFEMFGYDSFTLPHAFLGEEDTKYLRENIYITAYKSQEDIQSLQLIEKNFELKFIKIDKINLASYSLDNIIFPLTYNEILVCTKLLQKSELKSIESVANVIDVDIQCMSYGICKSLRLHNMVLNASNIHDLSPGNSNYRNEIRKNRQLEDVCVERGFEIVFFNLSEFTKKDIYLSSLIMHGNHFSYLFETSKVIT